MSWYQSLGQSSVCQHSLQEQVGPIPMVDEVLVGLAVALNLEVKLVRVYCGNCFKFDSTPGIKMVWGVYVCT